MKGVVKFADGKDGWKIRDVPREDPKPDEVEIQIKAAGICGSELHLYHDNHWYTPGTVIGHEYAGEITRVGANVKDWSVGDGVVAENVKNTCCACDACRSGSRSACTSRPGGAYANTVGYGLNGGWTHYLCMPISSLLKIPDGVSYDEAAMAEPTSVITQALYLKTPVKTGETVLIQGCGTIGILCAQVAKAAGAGTIIIAGTDIDEAVRLPIARKLGIEHVVNISQTDLKQTVMSLTGGKGADMVVEASGSVQAIASGIELIRKNGRFVAIGEVHSPTTIEFPYNPAMFKACSFIFNFGTSYESWKLALQLMGQKKLNLLPMITHRLPLEKFQEGFELLDSKQGLKVILDPAL